ncbi:MAG: excinuclease ABC subunit UvrA [bacterium]|nr:excinuclease ABC subunit UvrA [bacterium]
MRNDVISVRGCRVHNLQNIDVDIPRGKFVVITGLSGSGKSSLAFDTIYAEGQRRYVESLSAYARQFLGLADKPDVDEITGLSPTIAINQKALSHNPRSTVGTITEIYDYLRVLFARVGVPHCPSCGAMVQRQSRDQMVDVIFRDFTGQQIMILAPLIRQKKGEHKNVIREVERAGYLRVRFDGAMYQLEEALELEPDTKRKHDLDVVVDRVLVSIQERSRIAESVEAALDLGNGLVTVARADGGEDHLFSESFSCAACDVNLPEFEPRHFSFNSPHGACSACTGLGTLLEVDPDLVMPNKRLSLAEGAIRPWSRAAGASVWYEEALEAAAGRHGFSTRAPVSQLSKEALGVVLRGDGTFEGVIPNLDRRWKETESDYMRKEIERYMRIHLCPSCHGKRLKKEVLGVTIADRSIADLTNDTIVQARDFFAKLLENKGLSKRDREIARLPVKEVQNRLAFLENVGLAYLTIDRSSATLSGGEAQRIRLATQIGSALSGVIYVLDEPTIGLHQRDNARLITTLEHLRDLGNTVLVVEHDAETIAAADYLIDIGPGAGKHGGKVVAQGTVADVKRSKDSITGKYLSGRERIAIPVKTRKGSGKELAVLGCTGHNLKNIDVRLPLGTFLCITGVSGSGKSTFAIDTLSKALAQHFYRAKDEPAPHKKIEGIHHIDKVIHIDQSPIGRTPRSNPATYTGLFTPIRDLFTQVPEAKIRGYKAGRFSFNVKGGRCETCEGDGMVKIEMQLLPDVYVECEECHGKRYNRESLDIHYKGKNIADVLGMTVEESVQFFEKIPAIANKLRTLFDVGLGYITLGQSATTLSGGEAQRIKLATELSRRATGKTLYLLDEPTTGLHFADVKRLLEVLHRLVDKGNTVLVIEHNLDVIAASDWIVDLGLDGGAEGGYVVAQGSPRDVAKSGKGYTADYLKKVFAQHPPS